jgi:hypothetical protein
MPGERKADRLCAELLSDRNRLVLVLYVNVQREV